MTSGDGTPEYRVRVSDRARRVRLAVSPAAGLVVVVPRGFPSSRIDGVVRSHRAWIERALERTAERRDHLAMAAAGGVPDEVAMPGIGVTWRVVLHATTSATVRADVDGAVLTLRGDVGDVEACLAAIRRAVTRVARERLPLMLGGVEAETGWSATRVTIRRQRTRWGSCSAQRSLSLNESLVFLPQRLVRYVLVHELAHTQRMDHSPSFWAVVERHEAGWRGCRRDLRDAWRHVPGWADASSDS